MDQATIWGQWLLDNSVNVLVALAIIIVGFWIGGLVKRLIHGMSKRHEALDETIFGFLGSLARYAIIVFAILMVLERFGIETTSLVAIIGAAGLAIGLALQGTLANLAAGVMIMLFRPFKVGDFVDAAGTFGQVDEINLFTTEMGTFDAQKIIIPNGEIWGAKITNHSHHAVRGVDMVFGVAYGTDIKKAKASILKALEGMEHVLAEPAPFVEVETLNESSVDFLVRPFCDGAHWFDVRYGAPEAVYDQLNKDKIEIPFPQRVVHMSK
ncbi:MAG: mechanosensitive ion channel domain-containing protein [Pseudomonadota bacterium]